MLMSMVREINKLPQIITRQQVLNWYIAKFTHTGTRDDLTTEEVIFMIERTGRKVQGQSRLAINISLEEEEEFISRRRIDLGKKKANVQDKLPDSEKDTVRKLYWEQGLSMEDIARKYNCSQGLVDKRMKKWKLETRPRGSNMFTSTKSREVAV